MTRPLIFISYSHRDENWKDRVVAQLGVSQQFELWDDRQIAGGDDWHEAITNAIEHGAIAVLLVSAHSLSSDYIRREELPRFLQLRKEGRTRIFPIVISSCDWESVDWLRQMNLRPRDGRALNLGSEAQIDADLAAIAKEIRLLLQSQPSSPAPAADSPYLRVATLPAPKLFVGRESHLVEIERRLRAGGAVGLISLKGTAGVGKSALALESAYRFGALFPGGRFWVDLRAGDAANAVRAMLRDLDAADRVAPDSQLPELCNAARAELAGRRALVILDNAETIEAAERESLLDLCATTIITSRVSIDPTTDIAVDTLTADDAIALLRERGVDVEAERDGALRLIERLGGLALALEITARRMASYRPRQSCAAALDELNRSRNLIEAIRLPRGNKREDNIAEAFALSYRKLDADLQAAFHALGLSAESGAPLEGIARMLGQEPDAVRDLLLALTDWSLADFGGERAVLHPLLHSYAEMCARQQPERAAEMIVEHARYFGYVIGGSYQRAIDEDDLEQDSKLPLIDREVENVTLAQIRTLEEGFGDPELAVETMYGLRYYWHLRDEPRVLRWLHRAQNLSQRTGQTNHEGYLLKAIGDVQSFRDEKDAALQSYDQALTLFKQVGDNLGQANVFRVVGDVQSFRGEKDAALKSYNTALDLYNRSATTKGLPKHYPAEQPC
ncbi:MAG: TIR domain-containing protein [Blastocatellia bacterium]